MNLHVLPIGILLFWSVIVAPIFADPWTLPRRDFSLSVTGLGTSGRKFFNDDADRTRFLNDGRSRVVGVDLSGSYGLFERVSVALQIPVLFYKLKDDFVLVEGNSLGDIRTTAKLRLTQGRLSTALEGGVKFPTATQTDPSQVQVGEGQFDYEITGSAGSYADHWSGYVDAGYRFRRWNGDDGFKPDDEILFRASTRYTPTDRISFAFLLDGLWGGQGSARAFGLQVTRLNSARRLIALIPSFDYRISSRLGVSTAVTFPIYGRNNYAGSLASVSLTFSNSGVAASGTSPRVPTPRGGGCCTIQ